MTLPTLPGRVLGDRGTCRLFRMCRRTSREAGRLLLNSKLASESAVRPSESLLVQVTLVPTATFSSAVA